MPTDLRLEKCAVALAITGRKIATSNKNIGAALPVEDLFTISFSFLIGLQGVTFIPVPLTDVKPQRF